MASVPRVDHLATRLLILCASAGAWFSLSDPSPLPFFFNFSYGEIVGIKLLPRRANEAGVAAFIDFADVASAERAFVDMPTCHGRGLRLDYNQPRIRSDTNGPGKAQYVFPPCHLPFPSPVLRGSSSTPTLFTSFFPPSFHGFFSLVETHPHSSLFLFPKALMTSSRRACLSATCR
jgi:hypothetical protein